MVLYRRSLAQEAKDMGLKPPKVAFVRFIDPSEVATTVVSCMNELGLPAKPNGDGNGWQIPDDVPDSQSAFIKDTVYRCQAMYPTHPQFNLPPSTASLGRQYDWLATKLVSCYRAQGFQISDPPSKAVWIASYTTDPWSPDQSLPEEVIRNPKAKTELDKKCPLPGFADLSEHPPVIKK